MQDSKPIAYASRSMTSTEKNYAQIEKKMLSIVFAVQKFHQYVYGKSSIVVENYHIPIQWRSQDFFKGGGAKCFEHHSPGAVAKPLGSSRNRDIEVFLPRK